MPVRVHLAAVHLAGLLRGEVARSSSRRVKRMRAKPSTRVRQRFHDRDAGYEKIVPFHALVHSCCCRRSDWVDQRPSRSVRSFARRFFLGRVCRGSWPGGGRAASCTAVAACCASRSGGLACSTDMLGAISRRLSVGIGSSRVNALYSVALATHPCSGEHSNWRPRNFGSERHQIDRPTRHPSLSAGIARAT